MSAPDPPAAPPPACVTLHVWGVSTTGIAPAIGRLALDRFRLRGYPGLTFAKLLGIGSGQTLWREREKRHSRRLPCRRCGGEKEGLRRPRAGATSWA